MEFSQIVTIGRKRLELKMDSAKTYQRTPKLITDVFVWLMNLPESAFTRRRTKIMKITLLKKVNNSLSHRSLVHKHILLLQALKTPDAKATVDRKWEKFKNLPGCKRIQNQNQTRGAQKEGNTVHFATLIDLCHLKKNL